jgi:hypothetical protein
MKSRRDRNGLKKRWENRSRLPAAREAKDERREKAPERPAPGETKHQTRTKKGRNPQADGRAGECNTYCSDPLATHASFQDRPRRTTASERRPNSPRPQSDLRHPEKARLRNFGGLRTKRSGRPTTGWGPGLICRTSALQRAAIEHRPGAWMPLGAVDRHVSALLKRGCAGVV